MRRTHYTSEIRVLLCEACGAPIEALPEGQRGVLAALRERLSAVVGAAVDGHGRNGRLANSFLEVLSRSMEAVQQAVASLPLYTTTGEVGQAHWRGCVVRQTA